MTVAPAPGPAVSLARLHNPADIEWALAEERPPLLPPATDRASWSELASRAGSERTAQIVEGAEEAVLAGIPDLTASLYLDYSRSGSRERHREPFKARRAGLARLVLAECLEAEGRFLDPILDLVWAICEESSWALPAHQVELASPEESMLDLTSAMTALDMAEAVVLLGERLEPGLATRVYDEIDRRCFTPYLHRNDLHWLFDSTRYGVNNWAAVCNAGVLGAALHLEPDPRRTAQIICKGLRSLDDYLATFAADGGSSEGAGYWTYGFGYFTLLADLLERGTGGLVDPLGQLPNIGEIARFPLRTVLEPGSYVTFSDTDPAVRYWRPHLEYLGRKLAAPELTALGRGEPLELNELDLARSLRSLLWTGAGAAEAAFVSGAGEAEAGFVQGPGMGDDGPGAVEAEAGFAPGAGEGDDGPGASEGETVFAPTSHDWLPDLQWFIARHAPGTDESLVVAVKGGHNAEMHNHNDVGTLIVRSGGETLLPDLGRGRYTRDYFGAERYSIFVRSSLGHSVPVVNGRPQQPERFAMKSDARRFAATVVERFSGDRADALELEMAAAYGEEAGLETLRRRVTLERRERRVRLVDSFGFPSAPGVVESVLITLGEVRQEPDGLLISGARRGLRIALLTPGVEIAVEERAGVELARETVTVRRLVFRHQPAERGHIELLLTPVTVPRPVTA